MTTQREPNIDLEMIGVPMGAILTLRGHPHRTCIVVQLNGPPRVAHAGTIQSLSAAAMSALQLHRPPNGALHWEYNGETLQARRERYEEYYRRALDGGGSS